LSKPIESSGNNLRHYYRLLDELAENVVDAISVAEVATDVVYGAPRALVDPLRSLTSRGTCTV
jgi:hypothetical protein